MNAVVAIERKINRTRFRDLPVGRWAGRGARCGLWVSLFLAPAVFLTWLFTFPLLAVWGFPYEPFLWLPLTLFGMALGCALVGAILGILALTVFRPVWVALFHSIGEWEREYGDRRPRLPPLGPPAHSTG